MTKTEYSRKKQTEWSRAYGEKAYDQLQVRIPKGDRQRYKDSAEALGMSLAGLVKAAVEEYLVKNLPNNKG